MQTGKAGGGGTPMNKGGFASALVRLNHITHRIVLFIAQASILAMVAIVTLTVILRYCFNTGLSWAEEVPRLLVTVFAFIGCAIGKTPIERTSKNMLPLYAVMVTVLLLVTYIPEISLWLPRLTGYAG